MEYIRIDRFIPYIDMEDVFKLLEIWRKYHLNDCKAGTELQINVLDEYRKNNNIDDENWDYDKKCEILQKYNLLVDRNYRYGSKWLVRIIPKNIINYLEKL